MHALSRVFCIFFSRCVAVAGLLHHVRVNLTAELTLTHTQQGSEGYFKL